MSPEDINYQIIKKPDPSFVVPHSDERYDKSAKDSLKDMYIEIHEAQSHHLLELGDLWTVTEASHHGSESITKVEFVQYLRVRLFAIFVIGIMSFGVAIFTSYDLLLYLNKIRSVFDPVIDLMLLLMSLCIVVICFLGANRLIEYRIKADFRSH